MSIDTEKNGNTRANQADRLRRESFANRESAMLPAPLTAGQLAYRTGTPELICARLIAAEQKIEKLETIVQALQELISR